MAKNESENELRKTVSFGYSQIRTFNRVMGDNPSVSSGPPISIGWKPISETMIGIDEYENQREERYTYKSQLRVSRLERELLLRRYCGVTMNEMAECVRKINRIKSRRRNTAHKMEDWSKISSRTMGSLLVRAGKKSAILPHEKIKNPPTQEIDASTNDVQHRSLESLPLEDETSPTNQEQGRSSPDTYIEGDNTLTADSDEESSSNDSDGRESERRMCCSLLETIGITCVDNSKDVDAKETQYDLPIKEKEIPPYLQEKGFQSSLVVPDIIVRSLKDDSTFSDEESTTCCTLSPNSTTSFFKFLENLLQLESSTHELDLTQHSHFIL